MLLLLGVDGLEVGAAGGAATVRLLESLLEAFEAFSLNASSCFWRNEDDIAAYEAKFGTTETVPSIVSGGHQTGLSSQPDRVNDAVLVVELGC